MKKLLLLINSHAGRRASKDFLFDVVDFFDANGYSVEVHPTRSAQDIKDTILNKGKNFDLVVCSGGDGTLNNTINGLMLLDQRPLLGYIPSGSTNDFARTLNISNNPIEACKRITSGKPTPLDIGKFNDIYFTYVAAFGAFTNVSYQTPQPLKNSIGIVAYLLEGLKELPEIKPQRVKVTIDNKILEDDYIFGSVSNSTSVAGVLKLKNTMVSLGDGKFELMLIKNPHDIVELNEILTDVISQKYSSKYVSFFHTSKVVIDAPNNTSWTLDGEGGGNPSHVIIENINKAVNFML